MKIFALFVYELRIFVVNEKTKGFLEVKLIR